MRLGLRLIFDRSFTILTWIVVVALSLVLLIVLGPMLIRGGSAIFFYGTVEFRRMQLALYHRGDYDSISAEIAKASEVKQKVYQLIDAFKQGIDTDRLKSQVRRIHRQFGQDLQSSGITGQSYTELRAISAQIRDRLERVLDSEDNNRVQAELDEIITMAADPRFTATAAKGYLQIANHLKDAIKVVDLSKRRVYASELADLEGIIAELIGPRPDAPPLPLLRQQYGATRWGQAQRLLDKLLYKEQWIEEQPGRPLVRVKLPRRELFAGTTLEPLFDYVLSHLEQMLLPRPTFYWQFLIDDSFESHTFGGIGPELLGTAMITILAMTVVVPLGIICAAYLAEGNVTGPAIRIIRMCINTLAGVPSIVFGLFGLAFFVLTILPALGFGARPSILAAGLTLAVLALPVMIRASEEAIRAVPQSYKEAALSLGAGPVRTFLTVTFPAALPGILTGIILSLSRIAGETAPVLFTGAVAMGPIPRSILQPTRTLSYGSYDMAVGDRIAELSPHNQYGMVATLVALVLALNATAILLRSRASRKLSGQ